MTRFRRLLPAALVSALLLSSPAFAAEDASHYQLTPAMMDRLKAAEADMKLLPAASEAPEVDPDQSIDAAIRKIEKDKATIAVLAKHGLTGRDLVLSAHALMHAGTFISTAAADPKKSNEMYKGYTREQQANIDLVRSMVQAK